MRAAVAAWVIRSTAMQWRMACSRTRAAAALNSDTACGDRRLHISAVRVIRADREQIVAAIIAEAEGWIGEDGRDALLTFAARLGASR